MTEKKKHSAAQPSALQVDVEGLLAAIQTRTSGERQEYMEQNQPPPPGAEGQRYPSCSELAEAFEIDICDYRACEANR